LYGLSDVFFDIRLEKSENCGLHASVDPLPEESELLPLTENDPLSTFSQMYAVAGILDYVSVITIGTS
jgi:hypothetical protein